MNRALTIAFLITSTLSTGRASDIYLTYSQFVTEAQAGHIKSATLNKYSDIQGFGTINGKEQSFHTYSKTGSINDPLLVALLNDKAVQITTATEYKDVFGKHRFLLLFVGLSMIAIPWITFVLVMLLLAFSIRILARTKTVG